MTGWIKYFGFAVMLFLISGCSSVERLNPDDVNALGQIDVTTASQRSDQFFGKILTCYWLVTLKVTFVIA